MLVKYFHKFVQIRNLKNILTINYTTQTQKNIEVNENKLPKHLTKIFTTKKEHKLLEEFPAKLFKKRHNPAALYIANTKAVKIILEYLKKDLNGKTILEVNPGRGLLTNELIKAGASKIILIECMHEFIENLRKLQSQHPNLVVKFGDFCHLWKLIYRDKIDNGTRLDDLLSDIPRKNFEDDPNMRVFCCTGTLNLFKHLINSIIFGRSIFSYGRCEMFLVVPPSIYIQLTCDKDAGYLLYRTTSILFQIMFEYQLLTKIPREYFLPVSFENNSVRQTRQTKIKFIDTEYLYLIRIIPRKNLYELCPVDEIKALWFFVQQNCISRKNRVIPNFEKWIPHSGPRLFINELKAETVKELYPENDNNLLPKYSKPCTTMSNKNYCHTIDIFTEFGELTPSQILTLFSLFKSWPEYNESSPFLASLENSLVKIETSGIETVDIIPKDKNTSSVDDDTVTELNPIELEEKEEEEEEN